MAIITTVKDLTGSFYQNRGYEAINGLLQLVAHGGARLKKNAAAGDLRQLGKMLIQRADAATGGDRLMAKIIKRIEQEGIGDPRATEFKYIGHCNGGYYFTCKITTDYKQIFGKYSDRTEIVEKYAIVQIRAEHPDEISIPRVGQYETREELKAAVRETMKMQGFKRGLLKAVADALTE